MFIVYVDEAGDPGLSPSPTMASSSPTPYFVLSGLVVHELSWKSTLDSMLQFRKGIRTKYGLRLNDEIHAHNLIHGGGGVSGIPNHTRLALFKDFLRFEATLPSINVINVVVNKVGKTSNYDVFDHAWRALLQRFNNTLQYRNFPGPQNARDLGLIIVDSTNGRKLQTLLRGLRRYNPIPNIGGMGFRQIPLDLIVEDPNLRDSKDSYFVQFADINASSLYQKLRPQKFIRKKGARGMFDYLDPILCKRASTTDPQGIVRL